MRGSPNLCDAGETGRVRLITARLPTLHSHASDRLSLSEYARCRDTVFIETDLNLWFHISMTFISLKYCVVSIFVHPIVEQLKLVYLSSGSSCHLVGKLKRRKSHGSSAANCGFSDDRLVLALLPHPCQLS